MVTLEMSKAQALDFRAFLRGAEGKDFTTLDDFFEFGKIRDIAVEAVAPILEESKARIDALNEELKPLRDAAVASPDDAEAKAALNTKAQELKRTEEERMTSEMVSVEFSDESHKFLKDNFVKLFVSKANSAEVAYNLAKALKVKE